MGTRLRPHTNVQPKALLNVAGKPILEHILDTVIPLNPSLTVFVVGFLGEQIEEYIRRSYRLPSSFIYQKELLGLGHAIYQARDEIDREEILIILGDTIVEANLLQNLKGDFDLLGVKEVNDPERFGIAEVENGSVKKLVEKPRAPKGNLALVGLYYIKSTRIFRQCLDEIVQKKITTQGEYQLTDALQLMIERGVKFKTFPVEGWYDCGKKETLLETNRTLLKKLRYAPPKLDSTEIIQPVYIASTARITESVIGPNVTITERSEVDNSKIKNSILWEGCRVKNAALHDSLIGQKAVYRGSSKFEESQSLNLGGND